MRTTVGTGGGPVMTKGVLVRVRARAGRESDAEEFLDAVLRLSTREQRTETSFLMRFPDGAYGLLDLFLDEPARREHLSGPARQAISYRTRDLFETTSDALLDVVDHNLPTVAGRARLATGTWLTFDPADESGELSFTAAPETAWLAVRFDGGTLALIDLSATYDDPEPTRLPEVCRGGTELRLVSSERFRLVGPDVPEPEITPLPELTVDVSGHPDGADRSTV